MNTASSLKHAALGCAILLGAAAPSLAATVTVKFDNPIFNGVTNPESVVVNISYPKQNGLGSASATVAAGRFQGRITSPLNGIDPGIFVDSPNHLFMYCYDLYEHIGPNWEVNYEIDFAGESDRTRDFLGAVNSVLNQGKTGGQYDKFAWLHPADGYIAAAVQLGIWESKYEDESTWDISNGAFHAIAGGNTSLHLSSFFGAILGTEALDGQYVMTLKAPNAQDMITGDPPGSVPEPGTLGLLAAAGLGLLAARRKTPSA